MRIHFFTAPFYFAFIWFRVQGSGLSWRLRRLILEDGILVSQPSPLGEGAPQGRTGQTWYERQLGSTGKREAHLFCIRKHPSAADAVPLLREGKAYKVSQSPVIPLISGEWIVSHVWHEILRLSPYLFWLGLFTHGAFSSAQDDDTRGRMVSQAGGIAAFFRRYYPRIAAFPSRAMLLS